MAAKNERPGGNAGKVPPRPGTRSSVPARPSGRTGNYGSNRPGGRATPRVSARQITQRRRQRNIYLAGGSAALVIIVVVVLLSVSLTSGGTKKLKGKITDASGTFALSAALVKPVENVPLADLVANAKAKATGSEPPQKLAASAKPLSLDGKPEILYMGAEYCPYCAAERWSLVMALSKFGKFGTLRGTTSSSTDEYPDTPTFALAGVPYTSKYLSFVPVEMETNTDQTLETPTHAEDALIDKWDMPPYVTEQNEGAIPFIYMDGKYLQVGAQYVPTAIQGMQFQTAVSYQTSGTNATSKAAEASAGYLVGDICTITKEQPASVCGKVPTELKGITTTTPNGQATSGAAQKTQSTAKTPTTTKKS